MTIIKKLDWDSSFFGYEIGKIIIENVDLFDFEYFLVEAKKYSLVYVFSADELPKSQFYLVDKKVLFKKLCKPELIKPPKGYNFLSYNSSIHNSEQLINLALQSGIYSRFFIDSNFKDNEYIKLYKEWILKSISGDIAFDVIVATTDNIIVGLITIGNLNEKVANIGLIAVDKYARGIGLGKQLVYIATNKCHEMGYDQINVFTQLNNIPSVALYKKTNFIISDITNIYHYWNL